MSANSTPATLRALRVWAAASDVSTTEHERSITFHRGRNDYVATLRDGRFDHGYRARVGESEFNGTYSTVRSFVAAVTSEVAAR